MRSAREGEDAEHREEVETLHNKLKNSQRDIEDLEYQNQTISRELRKEKTQVEKTLKEREAEVEKCRGKICDLESKFEEAVKNTGDVQKLQSVIKDNEAKIDTLDGVIKDLERCLTSTKESQDSTCEQLERYKLKCRELENNCNNADDQLQTLQSQLDEVNYYHFLGNFIYRVFFSPFGGFSPFWGDF